MHDHADRFLLELLLQQNQPTRRSTRAVAFVGTTKNAGKTTALNAALDAIAETEIVAGLVSVGVDGESTDSITGGRKPPILARAGAFVATAEGAIARSDAQLEILGTLPIRTPLGELIVGRVRREGHVLLAGVRHRADVIAARDRLVELGATLVFVDGAFDRLAAAAPDVSDAVVLSTGAALGPNAELVAARTAELVARLCISRAPLVWRGLTRAANNFGIILRDDSTFEPLPASPTANPAVLAAALARPARALVIPGLFGDRVADVLLSQGNCPAVLVPDATHVMCTTERLARLARNGVSVSVDRAIRVAAITVNPVAPSGSELDRVALIDAMAAAVDGTTILDVVAQELRGAPVPQ
jgi:hypothetical protein